MKPLARYGLNPTTSRMTRLRATFTGAKWRFVSKASARRAASNAALVTIAPRKKSSRLISVCTATQLTHIYKNSNRKLIRVICGYVFVPGMARADGCDSDTGAVQRAGVDLRTQV